MKLNTIERTELIERLARKLALFQGYIIASDIDLQNSEHPRIQMYVAMAILVFEEFELH